VAAVITAYDLPDSTCEGIIAAAEAFGVGAVVVALDETLARQRLRAAGSSVPVLTPSTSFALVLRSVWVRATVNDAA
jgi:hypothetical protein